ncbi:hypothetical protein BGX24_006363 [Mortierella sp. AD032]|nr:hypothetical protein BGX24_006363 [Mortierella sp. AD032]
MASSITINTISTSIIRHHHPLTGFSMMGSSSSSSPLTTPTPYLSHHTDLGHLGAAAGGLVVAGGSLGLALGGFGVHGGGVGGTIEKTARAQVSM